MISGREDAPYPLIGKSLVWFCFSTFTQFLVLKEARNTEKTEMQFPLLFCFGFFPGFFSYFPVTQFCLFGELVRCWSFVLKSNCLLVTKKLKKFIYFCPSFAARVSVFLQSQPLHSLTSSPGASPTLPYFFLHFHSIVYSPPQQKSAGFWEMFCSSTTQVNWFKRCFPILYFSYWLTGPLWLGENYWLFTF